MTRKILQLKAQADMEVGALTGRLNLCGPRGNRSVESQLDYQRGRSAAFGDVLRLHHAEMDRIEREIASR